MVISDLANYCQIHLTNIHIENSIYCLINAEKPVE